GLQFYNCVHDLQDKNDETNQIEDNVVLVVHKISIKADYVDRKVSILHLERMLLKLQHIVILLCMYQVFAQNEEVAVTPDVAALRQNMNKCMFQTVMCCYTRRRAQNGGGRPVDNTDVCRAQGVLTNGDREGNTYCHGFTWAGPYGAMTEGRKRLLLDIVNTQDQFRTRGYFGAIGEYNKCDCIENMPVVSRADCSELNGAGKPKACDPRGYEGERDGRINDLADKYRSLGGN
ncbi:hypothetical protein MP638_006499, partial [Amoeboaphelidium occidentale]